MNLLSRFGRNLIYGFRRELRPYEAAILDHVFDPSAPGDREALRFQLASRERIQRSSARMLYFGLPQSGNLPQIQARAPDYCCAKVELIAPMGKVIAKVMTHHGILSTVEFSKAPLPILSHGFEVSTMSLHAGGTGYAGEIDALEHDADA